MVNNLYGAPTARVEDPPSHTPSLSSAPLGVKTAIILSWLVLAVDSFNAFWQIYADASASEDLQFKALWIALTLTSTAITALFIFQASRQRNWGRLGLLVWTLGSWCLWIVWPQATVEYTWWKWLVSGTLIAMELAALVLLFFGEGARWYSSAKRRGTSAL